MMLNTSSDMDNDIILFKSPCKVKSYNVYNAVNVASEYWSRYFLAFDLVVFVLATTFTWNQTSTDST